MANQGDVNIRASGLPLLRTFRKTSPKNSGSQQNLLRTGNDLWHEISDRRKFLQSEESFTTDILRENLLLLQGSLVALFKTQSIFF